MIDKLSPNTQAAVACQGRVAVLSANDSLYCLCSGHMTKIASEVGPIRSLCASGEYCAFWQGRTEEFVLMKVNGECIWSRRINTDKAAPHGVYFSTSGDAVAFTDDYDGGWRVHFLNILKGYSTEFGPCRSAILFDAELRRFLQQDFTESRDSICLFDRRRSAKWHQARDFCLEDWEGGVISSSGSEGVFLTRGGHLI